MVTIVRTRIGSGWSGYQTNRGFVGKNHADFDRTLSSKQFATLVDVISEGEIEGSATASKAGITDRTSQQYMNSFLKDVFLDGTQIYQQNAPNNNNAPDQTLLNYKNIDFVANFGLDNQQALPANTSVEREIAVGTTVLNDTPVTVTVTDTDVQAVRVTVGFPALKHIQDNGDIDGELVDIDVKLIQGNGTTTTEIEDLVIGKSNDAYFRDYIVNFPSNVVFPVQIRVERDKVDSLNPLIIDAFQFTSYTEIKYETNRYPDVAHTKLRFDSSISANIPTRKFRIRGIRLKIPHNATVDKSDGSITYSGTFNGTFKTDKEWTTDPAWILFDILTNTRYGAGIDASSIDQYAFYAASVYNNEKIDNGFGGTEPRFSCNVNLNNSKEAFDLINDLCTTMNVMPFYSAGSITISQDNPTDPSYQFTLANVLEGGFTYSGSSQKTRHTVFNVAYFDMETQTVDFETVEDTDANITKFGSIVKNVTAFACTSRGQAARLGRWFLYNEQNATETCTFTATAEAGVLVRCGQVIQISDPVKAGVRRGGLVASATTTEITVDDSTNTDLDATNTAKLSVILPDGTLETKNVDSISGAVITVTDAFSQTPQTNTVWVLENTTIQPTTWRVISVVEEGLNYTITALTHNSSKYDFIEDGSSLTARTISVLNEIKDAPSGLSAQEKIVVINNKAVSKLTFSWQPVKGVNQYRIAYRFNNGNSTVQDIQSTDFDILNSNVGVYEIRVFSLNAIGEVSVNPASITFDAVGKTDLPTDVQNVKIEPLSDQFVRLRFDKSTDIDVLHGGNVVIRSSNLTSGSTFTNSVDVLPVLSGNVSETIVPNIVNGTYHLKFRDDGGRLSSGDASVTMLQTVPNPIPKLVVLEDREDTDSPPFAGNKVDCFISDEVVGLVLGSTVLFDDVTDFDSVSDFDFFGAVDTTGGHYDFANTLDLGGKQPLKLRRHFVTQGFYPNDLFDKRTANIDTWTDFDGATAFDVNAKLLVATTDSDPDTLLAATYVISGTTITVIKNSHGYSAGSFINVDFTSGTGVDGDYEIQTIASANAFTLTSATSLSTSGNCNISAEFSDFNPFVNGVYVARGFKFRCQMDTEDPAQSIEIDQLGYTAELEGRTETSIGNAGATNGLIASGTSTKSVTFTNSFFTGSTGTGVPDNTVLPSIGITIENAQQGDFFALSNISSTGFDIDIKDKNENHVNRNFKYAATGFGRGS